MKPMRGVALAVTGATLGLLGISVGVAALTYQQFGSNVGPAVVFAPAIAAGGVLVSFIAAMTIDG